jgi:ACT domain-containing protein
MEISKELIKEMLSSYLKTTFKELLPVLLKEALTSNDLFVGQDFVSIEEASRRYNICRRTIYNYHKRGYITLCSSEGKTFVSIRELETHIRRNPLARGSDLKVAA